MALVSVQESFNPDTEEGVVALLEKYEDSALIVAGGTFVNGLAARGLLSGVEVLIHMDKLDLARVQAAAGALEIGATTTFTELEAAGELHALPVNGAILDALEYPPVQVKNAATIGGCVASSCPFFDLPVCLLSLDAAVRVRGPGGGRELPIESFYPGLFENALEPYEFLTHVLLPEHGSRTASAFIKHETNANDLAILNVAVLLEVDQGGGIQAARVFVGGGVGETPVRAPSAERALCGATAAAELFKVAGEAARADVEPMSDHRASAGYRTELTKVLVERALKRAAERAGV